MMMADEEEEDTGDYIPAYIRQMRVLQNWPGADIQQVCARGVFLGSAAGRRFVRKLGIQHVFCLVTLEEYGRPSYMTRGPWVWFECPEDGDPADRINERHLPLDDAETEDLAPVLDTVLPDMEAALARGEKVLVHCAAGISRSASVVLAYLMRRDHCSLDQALATLRAIRPCVSPNPAFMAELRRRESHDMM